MALDDVTSSPLPKLAPRDPKSHKGDFGRVLVIGGSRGMAGAPALAGRAALRSGAGLVTLAVPRSIQATVAGFDPCYMTLGCGTDADDSLQPDHSDLLRAAAATATAIAIGPGLGADPGTMRLVHDMVHRLTPPSIVDADALNALAQNLDRLGSPGGPRILTPHPGEFQRLTGEKCGASPAERAAQATEICRLDTTRQTIVVVKGHQTVVTDGERYAVNSTGNPGMATGGTGDGLTGIIAALIGQGLSSWEAARLGVHVHGLAGDLAAAQLGQISLTATDLIDYLATAFVRD